MAYVAFTSGEWDPESPLTTGFFGKMISNIDDHTHTGGEGGTVATSSLSGTISQSQIASSAVGQGELKSTVQSSSGTLTTGSYQSVTLTGGTYSFNFLGSIYYGANAATANLFPDTNTNGQTTKVILYQNSGSSKNYYYQCRYVQASPPYNLGNGDIPLFVFAIVDNVTGDILSVDIAEDPPWANNGPTNIRPDFVKDGKKYQRHIKLPGNKILPPSIARKNITNQFASPVARKAIMNAIKTPVYVDVELTQAIKQADMPLIPHPFIGNDLTGKTVVMLDPVGSVVDDLYYLQGDNLTDIVRDNLIIGNTDIGAASPPNVVPVSAAWK